jgi:hypothetical protein
MRENGSLSYEGRKERREERETTISLIRFPQCMRMLLLNFSQISELNSIRK